MRINKTKLDIQRARKGLRMSELGVSKSVIQRINANRELKPYTIGKIAASLGCDVTDIIVDVR